MANEKITGAVFGRRLKDRREAAGLSQAQLAAAARVAQSYISQLETGASGPPTVDRAFLLAWATMTTIDYLAGLTDNPAPGKGAPLPSRWEEMVRIMEQLSEEGRAELLDVAGAIVRHEQRRAAWNDAASALEQLVGEDEAARLIALVVEAARTGDTAGIERELGGFMPDDTV